LLAPQAFANRTLGLSNQQGMISQGDVELSVISKNFFFTFFNFFIIFTVLGTASNLIDILERFGKELSSAAGIAHALADSLGKLTEFYTNFIILQALGLFPLRLVEFGALTLYPINLIGAKTPRGKYIVPSKWPIVSNMAKIMRNWSNRLYSVTVFTCRRQY
jgi:hypothetical protein